ncbi:hypothetical protein IEN85_18715 [Pelagicoccus sp. NFK12]|uniref:Uncharacterized protein n=1 Tax=Pelagicoccus enzymogenes TaxID=2773457 RepID=A0A927FBZ6_9BACT|nr:hypothetical protein [Pelagicoccus enzymogenes]MBD5781541.1 hypothetical protein [Pelagicoccus enzymogenes]
MNKDYIIPEGSTFKIYPALDVDVKLKSTISDTLQNFPCVRSFALFIVKTGWILKKKTKTICVLHDSPNEYAEANESLATKLNDYFSGKNDYADCISLDLNIPEQRQLAEQIEKHIVFEEIK